MAISKLENLTKSLELINKTNEIIDNYLPLTGGTLTGNLFFEGASNKNLGVKLTDSGTNADIGWEWSTTAGAGIALRSTSWATTSEQGAFIIYARSSSGTPKLVGTPAGSLKWNNQEVLRANSTLDATKLSGTIPTACYSNNAVTNTLNNTAKAYLTGSTTATTNTGGQVFDDGVFITTTAGKLNATKLSVGNENATMQYNSNTEAIEFIF